MLVEEEQFETSEEAGVVESCEIMAGAEDWEKRQRQAKHQGEVSEAAFLLKATSLGLGVAKPWGDNERFDFIVCPPGGRLRRVQVKSTGAKQHRGYAVNATCSQGERGKMGYTAEDIDFLIVHIRPVDAWYVLPVRKLGAIKHLNFYPDIRAKNARWERYREAWNLLE